MNYEIGGRIQFLDLNIEKNATGDLKFKIYRKPTHTEKYLDWNSYHHKYQKKSVINSSIGISSCSNLRWRKATIGIE